MCGIVVLLLPAGSPDRSGEVEHALNVLRHRGPDEGRLVGLSDPSGGERRAIFGFRRLAIQDLSPSGSQPMSDPSGRYTIVFNGEIYNHDDLRSELIAAGEEFKSRSDTEVLLRLLMREGIGGLARTDGMFALAMHDKQTGRVLIARDPFGIKPLYVYRTRDGAMAFASEIKAFTAFDGWEASANRQRCADFLARGLLDHTTETMFHGVTQLPPGGFLEVSLAGRDLVVSAGKWYALSARTPTKPANEWPQVVHSLLAKSVARQLRADVPVGSCLSGGVDSSSIVALAARERARLGSEPLRTITARPRAGAVDEGHFAALVASATGARATDVFLEPQSLWESLNDLVWTQDEPFSSTSIFAQASVFREARAQGLVVMLDGQGADEIFAGYPMFLRHALFEHVASGDLAGAARHVHAVRENTTLGALHQAAEALSCAAPAWTKRIASSRSAQSRLIARLFDSDAIGARIADPFVALGRCSSVRESSIQQLTAASLPMLLHWEDRNSMSASIEARVPFLSPALVETALGLPHWAKVREGVTKNILRQAMRGTVPEEILNRRDKVGFEAPERTWLTGDTVAPQMSELVDRALRHVDPILTQEGRTILAAMRRGIRPYDRVLWRAVCMGVWIERFQVRW